jgi:HAD superfamily hydrolase (TIGR01490 family)
VCAFNTKAAFFDVDGTLTDAHVWHGVMDYFADLNMRRWTHRAYMAYHFPLYILMRLGIISDGTFRKPWPAHLGWYIRGYTLEEAEQVWNWVAETKVKNNWRLDTCQILSQHKFDGYLTVLVSGTPVPLLKRLAKDIGADHVVGTDLEVKDGRFTGRSNGPACIADDKVILTQAYLEQKGIEVDYSNSYAYADSVSDHYMLEMVAHPVATYPDEGLRKIAVEKNWQIFPSD